MILERIEFKNFKRYSDESIIFHDGITGIIGNNGTGKSTIVQGILFALYGVRAGIEGDFINSSRSDNRDKCSVSLDFIKDGNRYNITRWYRRTQSTTDHKAQLKINNSLLADGVSDVEKEIERVIGMQASDFKNTIYAGQKDLSSLLDDSPAERQKWFMKMLGIDFLKKEADAGIKKLIDECRTTISGLGSYLEEKEKENIPEKRDNTTAELNNAEASLNIVLSEIETLEKDEEKLKKIADSFSERWNEYRNLENQIHLIRESNRQKSGYISKLEEKFGEYEKILPEFEIPAVSEENYTGLKKEYHDYKEKEKAHSKISATIEKLEYKLKSEKSELEEIEKKAVSFEQDKKILEQVLPDISKRKKILEEYDRLKKSEEAFRQLENGRIRIQEKLKHYKEQADALREGIESGEKTLREAGSPVKLDSRIKELVTDEKKLSEDSITLREAIKAIGREQEKLSKELTEINTLGEDGECPKCRRRLGEQYNVLESSLKAEIESNARRSGEIKEQIPLLEEKSESVHSELEKLRALKQDSDSIVSLIDAKKKERQALFVKVEEIIKEESRIGDEIANNSFSEEKIRELEKIMKSLEDVYSEFRIIEERLKEENQIQARRTDAEKIISELSRQIEDHKEKVSDIAFDPEKYMAIEEAFLEAESLHQKFLELKPKIDQLPSLKNEIRDLKEEIRINSGEIAATESTMESMKISEKLVTSALFEVEESRKNISGKKIEAGELKSNIKYLKKENERLENELADIEERRKRYSALLERMVVLEKTRGLIKEYIIYLLNVIRAKIESEVGRVLSDITDGRYENVLIDENFDILVNDLGDNFPARRFSGGEQDDIAIALRIALSRYLAEMHHMSGGTFMIFDEIFGSQDEERRSNLISALRTQESHFPQIFLISHISEIQGEFSTSLLVRMKDDWNSEVIEVSD
ncbi:MAG: SMC family ATPase [Methanomicrobiaceae archaeon]|nr:SMC family ATPase [Methanomicrobiaceae archaeon]